MLSGPYLIFIAAVLWALDGVLRRSLYGLPPITIVFFEHLIGLVIIAPFLLQSWRRELVSLKEWGVIGLVALFSGALGTLFFTTALLKVNFIQFSVVFLLQKLQPLFAASSAAIFLGEPIRRSYLGWAATALCAGFFVTFPMGVVNFSEGGAHVIAAGYALLAAMCWGLSTALSRYALLTHSYTVITGLRFLMTVPIALVLAFSLGAIPTFSSVTTQQYVSLFAISLSTGLVALWIYYRGLKDTPATVSTIVELAFPATAVLIDYFLYGVSLHWSQYAAALILLYAIYHVARPDVRPQ